MMTATEAHTFLTGLLGHQSFNELQLHFIIRTAGPSEASQKMADAAVILLEEQVPATLNIAGEEFVHYDTSNGPICTPKMPAWVLEEQEKAEARRLAKENARKAKAGVSRMTREEMAIEAENIAR
jgi:hypothetical protein